MTHRIEPATSSTSAAPLHLPSLPLPPQVAFTANVGNDATTVRTDVAAIRADAAGGPPAARPPPPCRSPFDRLTVYYDIVGVPAASAGSLAARLAAAGSADRLKLLLRQRAGEARRLGSGAGWQLDVFGAAGDGHTCMCTCVVFISNRLVVTNDTARKRVPQATSAEIASSTAAGLGVEAVQVLDTALGGIAVPQPVAPAAPPQPAEASAAGAASAVGAPVAASTTSSGDSGSLSAGAIAGIALGAAAAAPVVFGEQIHLLYGDTTPRRTLQC